MLACQPYTEYRAFMEAVRSMEQKSPKQGGATTGYVPLETMPYSFCRIHERTDVGSGYVLQDGHRRPEKKTADRRVRQPERHVRLLKNAKSLEAAFADIASQL